MQRWKFLVATVWVLLSQTTYEQCLATGCRPMSQVVLPQIQRVQVVASRAACDTLRVQMTQAMAQTEPQVQQAVEARSPGNSLRMHTTFVCQEER